MWRRVGRSIVGVGVAVLGSDVVGFWVGGIVGWMIWVVGIGIGQSGFGGLYDYFL